MFRTNFDRGFKLWYNAIGFLLALIPMLIIAKSIVPGAEWRHIQDAIVFIAGFQAVVAIGILVFDRSVLGRMNLSWGPNNMPVTVQEPATTNSSLRASMTNVYSMSRKELIEFAKSKHIKTNKKDSLDRLRKRVWKNLNRLLSGF